MPTGDWRDPRDTIPRPALRPAQRSSVPLFISLGLPCALPARDRVALHRWLLASIVAVSLAVAVGGVTRLT